MTLVTAKVFYFTDLCFTNAEDENNFFDDAKSSDNYSFLPNEKGEITTLQIATSGIKFILKKE